MMAVGEAQVYVRITLLHLWLGVSLFLSGQPQTGHAQYHNPPEVVIPVRVTGMSRGLKPSGWLSYSLHFGGQRRIINMKANKFLISRHFSVFTYTEQDALHEDHPFVQNDCYYHGYVEGDPESLVIVSTCSGGFQGMLQINNTAYEIKPKSLSSTFEHLVFQMDSKELVSMRCGLTEEKIAQQLKLQESSRSILMQRGHQDWWTHRWFVELALVVDHQRFLHHGKNTTNVVGEVFSIVHIVNSLYKTVGISVLLLGLEIWNKENLVKVKTIDQVLTDFCNWKSASLNPRIRNDVAHLFVQHNFGISLGLAYVGTVCHRTVNCAVDRLIGKDVNSFAYIMTHEMGHNLGMAHDGNTCKCGQPTCIMAPTAAHSTRFSNCSYEKLWESTGKKSCMRMPPDESEILKGQFCGNGVKDKGEECDCGSLNRCQGGACCQSNCTFRKGAQCASGLCCKNCQFIPAGTLCREKENECDLPEWCTGISHKCPEDVHVQNGVTCMDGGYCYQKRCNSRDEQCRQIFGKKARSASKTCYREVNTRGDRFGNCGITGEKYLRCHTMDILCGRVQCENVTEIPLLRDHSTVHWAQFNDVTCWGTDYHWGMTIPDVGEVKDGTECGAGHVCIQRRCTRKSFWRSNCSPQLCNMNGICNSKHNCHCNPGWKPPFCEVKGDGGSIDSGPPPKMAEKNEQKRNFLWLFFMVPFVILFFCLFICLWKREERSSKEEKGNVQKSPKNEDITVQSLPEKEEQTVQHLPEPEETNLNAETEAEEKNFTLENNPTP